MASLPFFLYTLLTFSLSFYRISAVNYVVIQELSPCGKVKGCNSANETFNNVIGGIPFTKQIMGQINNYIWSTIFKQNTPADRKPINTVIVTVQDSKSGAEAITWDGYKINVSMDYLQQYKAPKELKWRFTSLLYHEMTHVFQWSPPGIPLALIEGIADYTILKANYFPPGFAIPGSGAKWDSGYDVTARFLEYCDGLVPGFVAKLNNMMRKTYNVSFFKNITGKPLEQLWKEYKAKYPGKE